MLQQLYIDVDIYKYMYNVHVWVNVGKYNIELTSILQNII